MIWEFQTEEVWVPQVDSKESYYDKNQYNL